MNLSPALRALLVALVTAGTAALTLTVDGVSVEDVIVIALAFLGSILVVPPQVGGEQRGLVNPTLYPAPSDVRRGDPIN
jgi:hypothetical protein